MHATINMASDVMFIIICPVVLHAVVRIVHALQVLATAVAECQRNFARLIDDRSEQ